MVNLQAWRTTREPIRVAQCRERPDMFDYIEIFYNWTREYANNGMLLPVGYEIK
jgi:hypothetical protein